MVQANAASVIAGLKRGRGLLGAGFVVARAGWVFGGGLENQLIGNWTAKVEYLLINLGSWVGTYTNPLPPAGGFVATHSVASSTIDHVVRVGLNYKFDGIPFIY